MLPIGLDILVMIKNGSLVYALIETIEMLITELNLDLAPEKTVYYLFEPFRFSLSNSGPDEMNYWGLHWFERFENGKWVIQGYLNHPSLTFEGMVLLPNSTIHMQRHIPLTVFLPGTYRICKDIENRNMTIACGKFYFIGSFFYVISILGIIYVLHLRKSNALNKYVAWFSLFLSIIIVWGRVPMVLEYLDYLIGSLNLNFLWIYITIIFFVV